MPEDLRPQFAYTRTASRAFNVPCIEIDGFEADDIIATYARMAKAAGGTATIISSDKDLMQLMGDGIDMLDPMKNKRLTLEGAGLKSNILHLRIWVRHYNTERPHRGRGIGNKVLQVDFRPARDGPIRRNRKLGGIVTSYTCDAA